MNGAKYYQYYFSSKIDTGKVISVYPQESSEKPKDSFFNVVIWIKKPYNYFYGFLFYMNIFIIKE